MLKNKYKDMTYNQGWNLAHTSLQVWRNRYSDEDRLYAHINKKWNESLNEYNKNPEFFDGWFDFLEEFVSFGTIGQRKEE